MDWKIEPWGWLAPALAAVLLVPELASAGEIRLSATVDNVISHDENCTGPTCGPPGSTNDADAFLNVSILPACQRAEHTLIRFNLAVLPAGITIDHVGLRLYAVCQGEYDANQFHVQRLLEEWNTLQVDWCQRETGVTWQTSGGTVTLEGEAVLTIPDQVEPDPISQCVAIDQWFEWDVTEIVRGWVNGSYANLGFCVLQGPIENSGNQVVVFASRENPNAMLRPVLVISSPSGACCIPHPGPTDDACLQLNEYECQTTGGVFLGAATLCVVDSCEAVTSVYDAGPGGNPMFLSPPTPNPTRGDIEYAFALQSAGAVSVCIVDVAGREVIALPLQEVPAGRQVARLTLPRLLKSGIYHLVLESGGVRVARKMMVLR